MRALALTAGLLLLAGCTGGSGAPVPAAAGSAPGSTADDPTTNAPDPAAVTQQVLATDDAVDEPVAGADGTFPLPGGGSATVRADVISVRATDDATVLRWRLRGSAESPEAVRNMALSPSTLFDTRLVTLVDTAGQRRLQPYTYRPVQTEDDNGCECSDQPPALGATGVVLAGLFPPLPPTTTTVDVAVPGLPVITGVPVTR